MPLTSIADRLTPSVPIEINYGAQPKASGRKFTTVYGHRASTGGSGVDYGVYPVNNAGDPVLAKQEVEALAGAGSQISKMVEAFVKSNGLAGRSNFPFLRIVILPNAVTDFGPADEALEAVKLLRTDMFVSCYPASDSSNRAKIRDLAILISGPDRDLNGQYGSFVTYGSIESFSSASLYNFNTRYEMIAWLPDTNNALVSAVAVDTANGSKVLSNVASTAGIYPGAVAAGTGIPSGAKVVSVTKTSITLDQAATAAGTAVSVNFQNVVSQPSEIVAAAHAAAVMSSAFPYNPLTNVQCGGLIPPQKPSDKVVIDPNGTSELALIAGLSPLASNADGTVRLIRTRTTLTTLPGNVTVTDYFDWQQIVVLYDFREQVYQMSQQPPFNNNPGGTKASERIAALYKDEVIRIALAFEDDGALQNVKESAKKFVVQRSVTSRGRFDFKIPLDVIPGLYVIAGNIVGVSDILNFTV